VTDWSNDRKSTHGAHSEPHESLSLPSRATKARAHRALNLSVLFAAALLSPAFLKANVAVTNSGSNIGNTASISIASFDASTGSPNLLLVGVAMNDGNGHKVTSVTFGAASFSCVVAITDSNAGSCGTAGTSAHVRTEIWSLLNFTNGTNTVTVNLDSNQQVAIGVVAFSGVSSLGPSNHSQSNLNTPTSATVLVVPPGTGGVTFSTLGVGVQGTASGFTPTSPAVSEFGRQNANVAGEGSVASNASTMSWTWTGGSPYALEAVPIIPISATAVTMKSFTVTAYPAGNLIEIKTARELSNLGFNIYREQNGRRVRVNPSLIAGSALLMRGALPQHTSRTYGWMDSSPEPGSVVYWLEDVDVNGRRTLHGPVTPETAASSQPGGGVPVAARMLNQLNQTQPASGFNEGSHPAEKVLREFEPTSIQRVTQFELAAHPAVKISVEHEGWHRVTQQQLIRAGLDPNVDPAFLHLYAEAVEQPIKITGATGGPGGFGRQAAIEFYGTGIDTPYSGTRVYWLAAGDEPGSRISRLGYSAGSNLPPASFPFTVEITPHTIYFAALINSNGNNFFGPLITSTPLDQTMDVPHFDKTSSEVATLELVLQGIIIGLPHDVTVALNGTPLGHLSFTGQDKARFHVSLPPGILRDWANTVTLTSQNGEYDTSLVQSIQITYPHSYIADSDRLEFSGRAGDELRVTGFNSAPAAVFDITDPDRPVELTPRITRETIGDYALNVQVPWSTTNKAASLQHTLLAILPNRVDSVAGIRANHPSDWHSAQPGSEIVMVSYGAFADALQPLVRAHVAEGKSTAVVPIDELYDEFSFGEHTPFAIRDFLQTATRVWHAPPRYLLLNGRASLDPRNYLGFGQLDYVPTRIVPTASLVTASDDWFSDFGDTGLPTIATGRLPVGTTDEASLVIGKIATYEDQSINGPWTSRALVVADIDRTENFTEYSEFVQAQLPSAIHVTDVFASTMSTTQAQQDILKGINAGQILVNYSGHGSEDQWSGDDIFDSTVAGTLTNGSSLPVFLIMDCLNGFFQDVYDQPLGVTLMLAPNGGAVAVMASSGLNLAAPQTMLDKLIVQDALRPPYLTLGDAIVRAKSGITDLDVRKTFNLLGDPAMRVKFPRPEEVSPTP